MRPDRLPESREPDIIIIDYGMGNLRSVLNRFQRLGASVSLSSDPETILRSKKLILPGVGHFAAGMKNLNSLGLLDILHQKIIVDQTPILGICLGLQLFSEYSEEGNSSGLGWIKAKTIRFSLNDETKKLKIPHMGWNSLIIKKSSNLFYGIKESDLFYFVHSYHIDCTDKEDILSTTDYGYEFVSAIQKGNLYGTQFHPEKSHEWGAQLIRNFISI
jgi:glutamine amidotransferase